MGSKKGRLFGSRGDPAESPRSRPLVLVRVLGLEGQAEEPPQALRRSRTDNTLLLLVQLGIPQHKVPRLKTSMQLLQHPACDAPSGGHQAQSRTGRPSHEPTWSRAEEETPTAHRSTTSRHPQDQARRAEAEETGHEAEGSEREEQGQRERGDVAAEEAQRVDMQRQADEQDSEAREVPQRATLAAEAPQPEDGQKAGPLAVLMLRQAGPPEGTRQREQMTTAGRNAVGRTAEMTREEGEEEAAEAREERAPSDADRQSAAEVTAEGEADDDDDRYRPGPADEDGYARGASGRQARAAEREFRPLHARLGQRRLGVGLAPAHPGPQAGWEQQIASQPVPTAGACPSSQQRHVEREELELEQRAAEQAEDAAHEEEALLATQAADRRKRAEYREETEEESEDVSVEAEEGIPTNMERGRRRGGRQGRDEGRENAQGGESEAQRANEADSKERAPLKIEEDEDAWHKVLDWDLGPLRASAQPFLIRRLPPDILKVISYLLRTTPADVLPRREWREWSERLLWTALKAAYLHTPSKELENSLVWSQATLPIALGGLGIIDPLSEALAAYLASLQVAQILLQHVSAGPSYPPAERSSTGVTTRGRSCRGKWVLY
ncbi:unnamed protein product [Closterium sp. Yama58-4]|nr:unnamed protein product [Closterium sp. Yama58-4]